MDRRASGTIERMGPVWKLMKAGTAVCDRCGREIEDYPAVGRVVDFQFLPEERYCWDWYRDIAPFVDELSPESSTPFKPVSKPELP